MEYVPSEFVTAVKDFLVATLFAVTVALGTACPAVSITLPESAYVCAYTGTAKRQESRTAPITAANILFRIDMKSFSWPPRGEIASEIQAENHYDAISTHSRGPEFVG